MKKMEIFDFPVQASSSSSSTSSVSQGPAETPVATKKPRLLTAKPKPKPKNKLVEKQSSSSITPDLIADQPQKLLDSKKAKGPEETSPPPSNSTPTTVSISSESVPKPRVTRKKQPVILDPTDISNHIYQKGDEVLATWTDGKRFYGVIEFVRKPGLYDVRYFDGLRRKDVKPHMLKPWSSLPATYVRPFTSILAREEWLKLLNPEARKKFLQNIDEINKVRLSNPPSSNSKDDVDDDRDDVLQRDISNLSRRINADSISDEADIDTSTTEAAIEPPKTVSKQQQPPIVILDDVRVKGIKSIQGLPAKNLWEKHTEWVPDLPPKNDFEANLEKLKDLSCEKCGKTFRTQLRLQRHSGRCTKDEENSTKASSRTGSKEGSAIIKSREEKFKKRAKDRKRKYQNNLEALEETKTDSTPKVPRYVEKLKEPNYDHRPPIYEKVSSWLENEDNVADSEIIDLDNHSSIQVDSDASSSTSKSSLPERPMIINCDCNQSKPHEKGRDIECGNCRTWQHLACIHKKTFKDDAAVEAAFGDLKKIHYICRKCVKPRQNVNYQEWMILDFLQNGILPSTKKSLPLTANGSWWEKRNWLRNSPFYPGSGHKLDVYDSENQKFNEVKWFEFPLKDKVRDCCWLSNIIKQFQQTIEKITEGQDNRRMYLEDLENIGYRNEYIKHYFVDQDSNDIGYQPPKGLSLELRNIRFELHLIQKPQNSFWREISTADLEKTIEDYLFCDAEWQHLDNDPIEFYDHPTVKHSVQNYNRRRRIAREFRDFDEVYDWKDDGNEVDWLAVDSTLHPEKSDRDEIRRRKIAVYKYCRIMDYFIKRYIKAVTEFSDVLRQGWECIERYHYDEERDVKKFSEVKDYFTRLIS